jgi:hypothetical protein
MKIDLTKHAQRSLFNVPGSTEVRCPNGHNRARLTNERDARGPFVHVWCNEPGCGAEQIIRPERTEA